jgi:hypothetical protein
MDFNSVGYIVGALVGVLVVIGILKYLIIYFIGVTDIMKSLDSIESLLEKNAKLSQDIVYRLEGVVRNTGVIDDIHADLPILDGGSTSLLEISNTLERVHDTLQEINDKLDNIEDGNRTLDDIRTNIESLDKEDDLEDLTEP